MPAPQSTSPDALAQVSLRQRAELGDAEAQLGLATCYRDGVGVMRCGTEALRWAGMAASQGHAAALDFIGFLHFTGTLVERDLPLAVGYFVAGADGCAQAAWHLGQCWFAALGVPQDTHRALEAWEKAAAMGHGRAAAAAAMACLSGECISADPMRARQLAQRATELGDPAGLILLGEIHFQNGEEEKARLLWAGAAYRPPASARARFGPATHPGCSQQGEDLLRLLDLRLGRELPEPGRQGLVAVPHLHQSWNNGGATSFAMLARSLGKNVGALQLRRHCSSTPGCDTDWEDLLKAATKIGLFCKQVCFPGDAPGFAHAVAFVRSEVDGGRPVLVDFTGPCAAREGEAAQKLLITGYLAAEDLYILCNPALATPGLQLVTATDLARGWRTEDTRHGGRGQFTRLGIALSPL